MYKSQNNIVSKSDEKMLKYRIMFFNILPFLKLDYASRITLYFVVLEIRIQEKHINLIIICHKNLLLLKLKINMFKMDVKKDILVRIIKLLCFINRT